jgi:RimJ/RimL family protein N-acetyltransferase
MDRSKIIETPNLVIRESEFEDCECFAGWESREDVNAFLSLNNDHSYKEVVTDFIKNSRDPAHKQYTITLKPDGKPIGRLFLTKINYDMDSLNFTGLYIAEQDDRRRGYGEEALRAMLEHIFIVLHMERVSIDHLKNDVATAFLCRKIGCRDEGIMRHAGKKEGKYVDLYRMSLLRADYYEKIRAR